MYIGTGCTNIFINGHRMPPPCCFGGFRHFSPGCFGYGFSCMSNPVAVGAGVGLGFAAGMALPGICVGIGKGIKNLWNKIFN